VGTVRAASFDGAKFRRVPPDHMNDGDGHDHATGATTDERTTAPMSEFTAREAGIGAAVAAVGLVVAVVVPLAFA